MLYTLAGQAKGISACDLAPAESAKDIEVPTLGIGDSDDLHTTLGETSRWYEDLKGPKELWIIEVAKHHDLRKLGESKYRTKVLISRQNI